jgi:hypothetical protein
VWTHTQLYIYIYFWRRVYVKKKKKVGKRRQEKGFFFELPKIHPRTVGVFPMAIGTVFFFTLSTTTSRQRRLAISTTSYSRFYLHFSWGRRRWGKKAITQLPIVCGTMYISFFATLARALPFFF